MAEEAKKFGIGEVQEILKKEFPDITISKIRFLEKEGLIAPERTPSGYRKYTREHVKVLSYILRLQRDEYLPLSVIKRKMQDLKAGKVVAGDLTVMAGKTGAPPIGGAGRISYELAPSKLGMSLERINELVDYGIVNPKDGPEGRYFSVEDARILSIAKEFFRYGVEPRHLRMFTQFVGREASFIEQIIKPQLLSKDPNTKRGALKDLENLMSLCQLFKKILLETALSDYLPRPSFDFEEEEDQSAASSNESAPEKHDTLETPPLGIFPERPGE